MLSKKRIATATLLTATLLGCGPGDAPYRFIVKALEIQLSDPREKRIENSMNLLGNCGALPTQIKVDIGLMKSDLPGMQSIPRHLRIDPSQSGWITEITPTEPSTGPYSIRIRGARPQELQFQPGSYLVAVTGYANCSGETAPSKLPFVYYSDPKEFTPGRELNLIAIAQFADQALSCNYSPSPNTPTNFTKLNIASIPDIQTLVGLDLFSPTAPSVTGEIQSCYVNGINIGPVPARGRYFVRVRGISQAQVALSKCYKFEGTGANTTLTGEEITPCPATGSLGI